MNAARGNGDSFYAWNDMRREFTRHFDSGLVAQLANNVIAPTYDASLNRRYARVIDAKIECHYSPTMNERGYWPRRKGRTLGA